MLTRRNIESARHGRRWWNVLFDNSLRALDFTPLKLHVTLQAYNNIRDQIVTPNGFDTDNRDLEMTAYQKNLAAPFENSSRDHSQISRDRHHEVSKSDQYAKARTQASSYGHEDNLTYPPTIPTQLAPFQSRPVRALRRTEVTTYRYHNILGFNNASMFQIFTCNH